VYYAEDDCFASWCAYSTTDYQEEPRAAKIPSSWYGTVRVMQVIYDADQHAMALRIVVGLHTHTCIYLYLTLDTCRYVQYIRGIIEWTAFIGGLGRLMNPCESYQWDTKILLFVF
jgi:hypothetical protein